MIIEKFGTVSIVPVQLPKLSDLGRRTRQPSMSLKNTSESYWILLMPNLWLGNYIGTGLKSLLQAVPIRLSRCTMPYISWKPTKSEACREFPRISETAVASLDRAPYLLFNIILTSARIPSQWRISYLYTSYSHVLVLTALDKKMKAP